MVGKEIPGPSGTKQGKCTSNRKRNGRAATPLAPTPPIEDNFETMVLSNIVTTPQSPVLIHNFESDGNLSNITKTVMVNISMKPRVVENIHVGQNYSASELRSYTTIFKEFRDIFSWKYQ